MRDLLWANHQNTVMCRNCIIVRHGNLGQPSAVAAEGFASGLLAGECWPMGMKRCHGVYNERGAYRGNAGAPQSQNAHLQCAAQPAFRLEPNDAAEVQQVVEDVSRALNKHAALKSGAPWNLFGGLDETAKIYAIMFGQNVPQQGREMDPKSERPESTTRKMGMSIKQADYDEGHIRGPTTTGQGDERRRGRSLVRITKDNATSHYLRAIDNGPSVTPSAVAAELKEAKGGLPRHCVFCSLACPLPTPLCAPQKSPLSMRRVPEKMN